jgi:hypothetical protein
MDWLAWLLAGTVIVYAGVYSYKCLTLLIRYNKVKDAVLPIEGKVLSIILLYLFKSHRRKQ